MDKKYTKDKIADELINLDASEKEKFFASVSHQLRSPLTSIKFIIEEMLDEKVGALTEVQRHKLRLIRESSERALNLVNDMLDVSRLVAKEVKPIFDMCDIRETIEGLIEMLKPIAIAKNQKILFKLPGDVHIVKICNEYLVRAFQNIFDNAITYGDEGSGITITLGENNEHTQYIVSVHNFGPIIPKEEMPKIFDKFHRVPGAEKIKPTGTGLGLFIAKSAIELNGGKIWIESKEGKGTTVYFTVPFKAPNADKA